MRTDQEIAREMLTAWATAMIPGDGVLRAATVVRGRDLEILRHALDLCSAECRPPIETLRALIEAVEKGTAK